MKKVKTFDEYELHHDIVKNNPNARNIWSAGQKTSLPRRASITQSTGGGMRVAQTCPPKKNDYCGKCGGETFVKQTVEQKLKTAEKHLDELVRLCNRYDKDTNIMSWEAVNQYIKQNGLDK